MKNKLTKENKQLLNEFLKEIENEYINKAMKIYNQNEYEKLRKKIELLQTLIYE